MRKILKKFRRRFIIIAMALVAAVSIVAFVAIGVVSSNNFHSQVDRALQKALMESNFGARPTLGFQDDSSSNSDGPSASVACYCVSVMLDGSITTIDDQGVDMDSDVLVVAVSQVLKSSKTSGFVSEYGLAYRVNQNAFGWDIAFADANQTTASVRHMVLVLVLAWIVLMAAVFFITLFLSRLVTKPVAQAWETQQTFIADASHELKTPLTVILADTAILKSSPDKSIESQSMWVDAIESEAERMKELTEDMLTLARDDAGATVDVKEKVDFTQLVERSLLQFEAVAFERGIIMEDNVAEGVSVTGDPSGLDNMIKTLLENACKYGEKKVIVTLRAHQKHAFLEIANDGAGISPEDLPHVFDRFYKSDKSRTREGEAASFGLGLPIAKSIAERHGGSMAAASSANVTTFTVQIPLAR